jgi:hypothetical protein
MRSAIRARAFGSALLMMACVLGACSGGGSSVPSDPGSGGDTTGHDGNGNGSGNGGTSGGGPAGGGGGSLAVDGGGASSGGPSNGSGAPSGPVLYLWSDTIHGGFDGQHPFLIPTSAVMVQGTDQNATPVAFTHPPTFTVADTSVATVAVVPAPNIPGAQGDPFFAASSFALITPKAAGQTTLTVTYDTQTVKATLAITAYTAQDVTLGQTRYTAPANPGATRLACAGCHAPGSDAGVDAPTHDPFFQQDLSDADLLVIVEKGLYDANDPNSALKAPGGHKWNLTTDEEKAIPAYLRSIPPMGF